MEIRTPACHRSRDSFATTRGSTAAGLVSVRTGGNHGERIYTLTKKGRQILKEALPYWERAERRLSQTMGDSELRLLVQLCESTVAAARQAEQLRAVNINSISEPVEYGRTAA